MKISLFIFAILFAKSTLGTLHDDHYSPSNDELKKHGLIEAVKLLNKIEPMVAKKDFIGLLNFAEQEEKSLNNKEWKMAIENLVLSDVYHYVNYTEAHHLIVAFSKLLFNEGKNSEDTHINANNLIKNFDGVYSKGLESDSKSHDSYEAEIAFKMNLQMMQHDAQLIKEILSASHFDVQVHIQSHKEMVEKLWGHIEEEFKLDGETMERQIEMETVLMGKIATSLKQANGLHKILFRGGKFNEQVKNGFIDVVEELIENLGAKIEEIESRTLESELEDCVNAKKSESKCTEILIQKVAKEYKERLAKKGVSLVQWFLEMQRALRPTDMPEHEIFQLIDKITPYSVAHCLARKLDSAIGNDGYNFYFAVNTGVSQQSEDKYLTYNSELNDRYRAALGKSPLNKNFYTNMAKKFHKVIEEQFKAIQKNYGHSDAGIIDVLIQAMTKGAFCWFNFDQPEFERIEELVHIGSVGKH